MRKDRFLVDVRDAGKGSPAPGDETPGIAGHVILILVVLFLVGTCS